MPDEKPDFLKQQVAKRVYSLSIARRFSYARQYSVLKRAEQSTENPFMKQIRVTIYKMIGRKED